MRLVTVTINLVCSCGFMKKTVLQSSAADSPVGYIQKPARLFLLEASIFNGAALEGAIDWTGLP